MRAFLLTIGLTLVSVLITNGSAVALQNVPTKKCEILQKITPEFLPHEELPENDFIARLPEKYPSLEFILKDPDGFRAEMEKRFEAAKLKNPEHPLAFDYSEIGLIAAKEMDAMIPRKLEEWVKMKEKALDEGIAPFWFPEKLGRFIPKSKRIGLGRKFANEIDIGTKYLTDLQKELNTILKAGRVNYDQSLELSYFFSRAVGHFDRFNFSDKLKILMYSEYLIQGYKDHPMTLEYEMYKNRQFSLVEYPSIDKSTRISLVKLESDFANKNKLLPIFVPTSAPLELDIFYRLEPYFIYPIGFTDTPIPADGVLREDKKIKGSPLMSSPS